MQAPVLCSACRSKVIITDPECSATHGWHAFNADEFYLKNRIGGATSLARYNKGLFTKIGNSKYHSGSGVNFDRIRVWDFRIQAATDRSLKQALPALEHMKETLGLSDTVIEKSAYFYRKASRMNLIKGRTNFSFQQRSAKKNLPRLPSSCANI